MHRRIFTPRGVLVLLGLFVVACSSTPKSATTVDARVTDASTNDSAILDFGVADLGVADLGAVDLGIADLGAGDAATTDSGTLHSGSLASLAQAAYVKPSNTSTRETFGSAIAFSADGNTLAVGAQNESSNATGVGGNAHDVSANASGAVFIFRYVAGAWAQTAYIKASNTRAQAQFGASLALSADGNTLAVGAPGETSNATGVNGDQSNTSVTGAGAVYVFRYAGSWSQQAYVKSSNTAASQYFGTAMSLSADGNLLAVGARFETGTSTGINGDESISAGHFVGAVYVLRYAAGAWTQEAYVKPSHIHISAFFGISVALSADGNTLAVGAISESSCVAGINGDQTDTSCPSSGATYLFRHASGHWSQQAYIKSSVPVWDDEFGYSVALSGDGNTLAVGAVHESTGATGINATPVTTAVHAGAAYVFRYAGSSWSQEAFVKASNTGANHLFGSSIALSVDGNTLAVGAPGETSNATGVNGDQTNVADADAGAVYMFRFSSGAWSQEAYVKASNTASGQGFGLPLAISASGDSLAVGAQEEASIATGINGNQSDTSCTNAGAAYVFGD